MAKDYGEDTVGLGTAVRFSGPGGQHAYADQIQAYLNAKYPAGTVSWVNIGGRDHRFVSEGS